MERIVKGVRLPREITGAGVNPERGSRQWGSGLSIDFIRYIAASLQSDGDRNPFLC